MERKYKVKHVFYARRTEGQKWLYRVTSSKGAVYLFSNREGAARFIKQARK